jgi:AcrR family transcriptional regulator
MVMPSPVQARAHATIQRAIDVTAELIDQRGEEGVRLQDVVNRSGVSAGSLTHHFGSRDGLVAAALMARYDRAAEQRARSFDIDASDPVRFAAGMAAIFSSAAAGERDGWRLARVRALAAARHRPALRAALRDSIARLEQDMTARVAVAPDRLVDGAAVCPRALVVFSESYSAGRIVDTVFGDPLPMEEWAALFARLIRGIVAAPVVDVALGAPREQDRVASQGTEVRGVPVPALAPEDRPTIPRLRLNADEQRMMDVTIAIQRTSGSDSVKLRDLVERTGLSRSWFARHFGEREELLDHVHLANLVTFSAGESTVFEAAFDEAKDPVDLLRRLADTVQLMSDPDVLAGTWDRLELIAAATTRPWLLGQAAPVVHATLERLASAVAGAQERGIVHADVPPRAAARFLWAAPLAFALGDVAGVEWPELHALAVRASATLTA